MEAYAVPVQKDERGRTDTEVITGLLSAFIKKHEDLSELSVSLQDASVYGGKPPITRKFVEDIEEAVDVCPCTPAEATDTGNFWRFKPTLTEAEVEAAQDSVEEPALNPTPTVNPTMACVPYLAILDVT